VALIDKFMQVIRFPKFLGDIVGEEPDIFSVGEWVVEEKVFDANAGCPCVWREADIADKALDSTKVSYLGGLPTRHLTL
jgi:hypothetical protein